MRASCSTGVPSLASSGRASSRRRAAARPSNRSPARSPGRKMALRQRPTPSTTPGCTRSGNTPARTSDDLPQPLTPRTRRKARPSAACRFRRSRISPIARVRPKKMAWCWNSKTCRPRKGLPSVQVDRTSRLAVGEADAELLQLGLDQFAQVVLQPGLEIGRVFEGVEGGDQRAVLAVKEPLDELVQQHLLRQRLAGRPRVFQAHQRLGRLAVHQQIGRAALLMPLQGVFELEFRAGVVRRAVGAFELLRQPRAQSRPENADHDIRFRRSDDLRLKSAAGQQRLVFPENRIRSGSRRRTRQPGDRGPAWRSAAPRRRRRAKTRIP